LSTKLTKINCRACMAGKCNECLGELCLCAETDSHEDTINRLKDPQYARLRFCSEPYCVSMRDTGSPRCNWCRDWEDKNATESATRGRLEDYFRFYKEDGEYYWWNYIKNCVMRSQVIEINIKKLSVVKPRLEKNSENINKIVEHAIIIFMRELFPSAVVEDMRINGKIKWKFVGHE
jgi:hypothetical protein